MRILTKPERDRQGSPFVLLVLIRAISLPRALSRWSLSRKKVIKLPKETLQQSVPLRAGITVPRRWGQRGNPPPHHHGQQRHDAVGTRSTKIGLSKRRGPLANKYPELNGIFDLGSILIVPDSLTSFRSPLGPLYRPTFRRQTLNQVELSFDTIDIS